jgi:Siphovirus Gp157.
MATLYDINNAMMAAYERAIDDETGEIKDDEAWAEFEQLALDRDTKVENIALWIKNLKSDAEGYKAEKDSFAKKQKAAENKAEGLKNYLQTVLNGEKYKSTRVSVSYRRSEAVEISVPVIDLPEEYIRYKEPEPDKTALKDALKRGEIIDGVSLVEKQSIQIR